MTTTTPFVVGLYIRVSTDRQAKDGDSLEEQESELRKFCDYRNFTIHAIFVESGKSAGTTNRPEYQKLVADIEAKKIHAVIVKKLDRLSRSLLDFEHLMITLQDNNIEFISLRENFDTTTAMGKAMLRMALVFAQLEREQTAERISDVMHYRATQGHRNGGTPPFGYVSANKELIVSTSQKPIVEQIFTIFLKTQSPNIVANSLNEAKLFPPNQKPWTPSRIEWILKNPTYKGMVVWKNDVYPGLHTPLIAPSVWDNVQLIFEAKKRHGNRQTSSLLLQKLGYCGHCHHPLTTSFSYNRTKTKYWYYRCGSTKHGKYRRESIACVFKYISSVQLHEAFAQALQELTTTHYMTPLESQVTIHNDTLHQDIQRLATLIMGYDTQIKSLKAKKNEYVDALITKQFSTQDHQKIHERMNELDTEIKKTTTSLTQSHLESVQLTNQLLHIDTLKETLLALRDMGQGNPDYRPTLMGILKQLDVTADSLIFHFKILPWTVAVLRSPP